MKNSDTKIPKTLKKIQNTVKSTPSPINPSNDDLSFLPLILVPPPRFGDATAFLTQWVRNLKIMQKYGKFSFRFPEHAFTITMFV